MDTYVRDNGPCCYEIPYIEGRIHEIFDKLLDARDLHWYWECSPHRPIVDDKNRVWELVRPESLDKIEAALKKRNVDGDGDAIAIAAVRGKSHLGSHVTYDYMREEMRRFCTDDEAAICAVFVQVGDLPDTFLFIVPNRPGVGESILDAAYGGAPRPTKSYKYSRLNMAKLESMYSL